MEVRYRDYLKLPEDVRPYLSQFNITEEHIPLIRKGMFNRNQVRVELNALGTTTVLGKPTYIKVVDEGIIIGLPTVSFLVPYEVCRDDLQKHNFDPDKIFSDFCLYVLEKVEKNTRYGKKSETRCVSYKVISQVVNTEMAEELIKQYGVLSAFTRIMGWKPIPEIDRLNFTRLFSIITNNHIFQLTLPNTGKTFLASRLSLGLNYGYFTEKITPARLIYNAGTKTYGEVFLRDGIILDEIAVIKDVGELEENLLSGLENGIWSRGVSGAEHLEEYIRKIPFMFFGNLINRKLSGGYNGREELKKVLASLRFNNIPAFTERIAICDLSLIPVNAGGNVAETFYTNSVLRGYVKVLKEKYREIRAEISTEYFPNNSRYNRYARDLEAFCEVLGIEIRQRDIQDIIEGDIRKLDKLFINRGESDDVEQSELSLSEKVVMYLQDNDGADYNELLYVLEVSDEELKPVIDNLLKYGEIAELFDETTGKKIYKVI